MHLKTFQEQTIPDTETISLTYYLIQSSQVSRISMQSHALTPTRPFLTHWHFSQR